MYLAPLGLLKLVSLSKIHCLALECSEKNNKQKTEESYRKMELEDVAAHGRESGVARKSPATLWGTVENCGASHEAWIRCGW